MNLVLRLLAAFAICTVCPVARPEAPPPIAITHVTVIDATGAPSQADQTIIISDARIKDVGPSATTKLPKGARIIDARGKFVIPGLWDMHVHLAGVSADPSWSKRVFLPLLLAQLLRTEPDQSLP